MKFSPAPWKLGYPGGIFAADGKSLAVLNDWPERDANALLMANAPVMLKLLKALAPYAPENARPKLDMFLKKFG